MPEQDEPGVAADESRPLKVDALLQEARQQTGLNDFGTDQTFRVGLERLVDALEDMKPSPYLRADARARIVSMLGTRLRLVEDARQHPEILAIQIEKPLFIVGLPRTGTTITFDMLSLDPNARYPRDWEWLIPWPATEAATIDTDPRIALIQPMMDRMLETAPELATVHRFDCTAPGECNTGMMQHFSSTNWFAEIGTAGHAEWLLEAIPQGIYADHKRLLQEMQWKGPKGRWLLKSPQHLFDLPGLFETYPDARVVWTHRDPVTTFSSLASMITKVQRAVRLDPDPKVVGDIVSRTWTRAILNAIEAREQYPEIKKGMIDLPHREVVRDPIAAIRHIYSYFGEEFSPEFERRVASFSKTDEKAQRIGRHKHSPEEYGIDPDKVRRDLAPYYARYGNLI